MKDYLVILYYHYVKINDLDKFREEHQEYCNNNNLLGRIYVAKEGINGTLSGERNNVLKYMEDLRKDDRFKNTTFKINETSEHAFNKMHVRIKNELVNFSLEKDVDPKRLTGEYIKPEDFYKRMQREDTIVIDARNDYEHEVGHFRGAIKPNIRTFRELPEWISNNKHLLKDKKIMTYCTGGIRCEKFSGLLKRAGYNDVGQLEGGIITYGQDDTAKGQLWDGKCYVFDKRLGVDINQVEHVVVGRDHFDNTPCERHINCSNPECNKQILASKSNEAKYLGGCTKKCMIHKRNRYVLKHNISREHVIEQVNNVY